MVPEVGIHRNVPFDKYLQWDAVSNSRLGLMAKSPLHYRHGFKGDPTPSMRLGSLVHCGVLEPDAVRARYAVMPAFHLDPENHTVRKGGARERSWSAATKYVRAKQEEWREANQGKEEVTQAYYDQLIGMANQICESDKSLKLFDDGLAEVSIVWEEPEFGLLCKARIDWLNGRYRRLLDLKTCRDPMGFEWAISDYGYDRQMAFYRRGLKSLTGTEFEPWLLAVETSEPYACRIAPCSSSLLMDGERDLSRRLTQIAMCQHSDEWPGYPDPLYWESARSGPVELVGSDGQVITI